MELITIIFTIIFAISILALALFGLHHVWLTHFDIDIPNDEMDCIEAARDQHVKRVKSLREFLNVYLRIIWKFDNSYWVKNVGIDGYAYLYFQRQMLKMFLNFAFASALLLIPFELWSNWKLSTADSNIEGFDEKEMKKYLIEANSILNCCLVYYFSIYCMITLFRIKTHVKTRMAFSKTNQIVLEALNAQSVHVRGMFPEDRKGELLQAEIEAFLEFNGGGRILSLKLVPDFVEIVDLENERRRLDDVENLYTANEPAVRKVCFPSYYRNPEYYEQKRRTLDDEIERVIMKPILSSGHVFICFDSAETRNRCLEAFNTDPKNAWEACWSIFKERVSTFSHVDLLRRKRMTSTFQKFNDEEMLQKLREKDMKIVMTPIPNPIDIFWSNMGGSRGFFFFRRLVINITAILILLFLTTPASLLRSFQKIEILNFLNLANYVDEDSPIGFILHEAVPPLLIILLNQLFLLLIDYSAFMEKHYSFSHCQISIFQRSMLYLGFNMFIIPAITLATADPLFEIIFQKTEVIAYALKDFYFTNAGNFFIIFLLQNAAISGAYHLMRMGEIMNSFGSSWVAFYKRHYLQDNERWRKKESDIFQYGYFYAQMLTAYTITLSYSISTPYVLLAGIFFYTIRHFVDGYSLLTVFKADLNSGGHLIEEILKISFVALLILQVGLTVSFAANGFIVSGMLVFMLLIVTILLVFRIATPIFLEEEVPEDNNISRGSIMRDSPAVNLAKWEQAYNHPLLVSNNELVVQRNERRVSLIIR